MHNGAECSYGPCHTCREAHGRVSIAQFAQCQACAESTHRIWVNTQQKHSFEGSTTFAAGGEACSVFTALRVHHVSESCVNAEQDEQGMLELQHS